MLLMSRPIFIYCYIKSQIKSLSILSKLTEMAWINARVAEGCVSLQHVEQGRLNYRKWWHWAPTWSRIPQLCGLGSLLDMLLCWMEPRVSCSSHTSPPTWKPTEILWGQVEAQCSQMAAHMWGFTNMWKISSTRCHLQVAVKGTTIFKLKMSSKGAWSIAMMQNRPSSIAVLRDCLIWELRLKILQWNDSISL